VIDIANFFFTFVFSLVGYMVRVDSSSMISTNQKIIAKRHTRKKKEYLMNENIKEISNYCKSNDVSTSIYLTYNSEISHKCS